MRHKLLAILFLFSITSFGQKSPAKEVKGATIDQVNITVKYSSPKVKGRDIYGGLVPYGEVWRAGANKNTTIEFDKNVFINGKKLEAGKYGFFIIPFEKENWILVFSKDSNAWGAYNYIKENDALRVETSSKNNTISQEELTYQILSNGIAFSWGEKSIIIPVERAKK